MKLLTPITVGELALPNRVLMAPLTRVRTDELTGIIELFRRGAENAREAGFDAVGCTARTVTCSTSSCATG